MRRVVVTGMAGMTPLGDKWSDIRSAMSEGRVVSQFEFRKFPSSRIAPRTPVCLAESIGVCISSRI